MQRGWRYWAKGCAAAAISGSASGVLLVITDPAHFNLLGGDWKRLVSVAVTFGLVAGANYLKQPPSTTPAAKDPA